MLTPREREIAALIARGFTYAEIGTQLEISPRTVDTHVSSAAKKLGDDGKTARIRVRDWWHRQKARIAGGSDG